MFAVRVFMGSCRWLVLCAAVLLIGSAMGCGTVVGGLDDVTAFRLTGTVSSAGLPIAGAQITVFTAGLGGVGSAAQPISTTPLSSDAAGRFDAGAAYTCTNPANMVYVVASGGNVQGWAKNKTIGLLTVLGTCGSLAEASPVELNEQSTVAAVWPLAAFARDAQHIGFDEPEASQREVETVRLLQQALSTSREDGVARTLNAAANAMSSCVRSEGGRAGDGTPCGSLFATAAASGQGVPADTLEAMISIARRADEPLPELYSMSTMQKQYQPVLTAAPRNWNLTAETGMAVGNSLASGPAGSATGASGGAVLASGAGPRSASLRLQPAYASIGGATQVTLQLGQATSSPAVLHINIANPSILESATTQMILRPGETTATFTLKGLAAGFTFVAIESDGRTLAQSKVQVWPQVIPSSFFGMTVKDYPNVNPALSYGTTRSWDAGDENPADDVAWAQMNPAPGVYRFDRLERFIAINAARRADIIYTFGRTPQWASSQPNRKATYGNGQCAPPRDLAAWDAYVSSVVKFANGRIHYWELWNEPNSQDFYCGDMPTLVTMAQHAYTIIKKLDPQAVVLSPAMTSSAGPSWLGYFLYLGGSRYVDAIAFHGYSSTQAEDIQAVIRQYRAVMLANGVPGLPLWDTEASWAGNGDIPSPAPAQQAAFLARYYLLQRSLGIDRLVWYAYDGGGTWGGLWSPGGGASQAASAYQTVYAWMVGKVLTSPCSSSATGLWHCGIADPATGEQSIVVWSTTGVQHLAAPAASASTESLDRQWQALANGVVVGEQPVLLHGSASVLNKLKLQ